MAMNATNQAGTLAFAAERELYAEIALFEVAMYRGDEATMQARRERCAAMLDSLLDLKRQTYETAVREMGRR